jgi:putative membrane protein
VNRRLVWLALLLAPAAVWAKPAMAHPGDGGDAAAAWSQWAWDPLIVLPLAVAGWAYARGLRRLWSGAGVGSGIRLWQAASFAVGWLALALALISPLDAVGEVLFSFHMIQHQILMLISAPLMAVGSPLVAFLWALPPDWRGPAGRIGRRRLLRPAWRLLRHPMVAWCLYALVLWAWHAPVLFEAALASYWLHALQHITFLGAALLFWWTAFDPRGGLAAHATAVLGVFTTAVHSSILGALMTFASGPWYRPYRHVEPGLALTPLEDQQLAGLVMWVPGGLIHLTAGLALMAMLIAKAERQARRREGGQWAVPPTPAGLE